MYYAESSQPMRFRKGFNIHIIVGLLLSSFFLLGSVLGIFLSDNLTHPGYEHLPPSDPVIKYLLDRQTQSSFQLESHVSDKFYLLGTDMEGRDIFVRLLSGSFNYLWGGFITIVISILLGIFLASLKYYYTKSQLTVPANFIFNVLDSFPRIIIVIIILFITNFSFYALAITIGLLNSTKVTMIVGANIEKLKNTQFIEAAKELGVSDFNIIIKHILWYNSRAQLIIQIIFGFASLILYEATLAYLNLGAPESIVTWGKMIYEGIGFKAAYLLKNGLLWESLPAALMIILTLLGFNLLAEGVAKRNSENY